jgi:MFS family permease
METSSRRMISKKVWVLSMVSLFADMAGEMLYPIIPVYLKDIGFSILYIGLLEGIAEITAGLSKGYFGRLSDAKGVRLPFVKAGYLLAAIAKPMMAIFTFPLWIFFARTTDRLGKGLRTAARDALLAAESTAATRARIFGFHRSFDTIGAVIGPLIALVYLYYNSNDYPKLFYIAFIPGLLAFFLLFILKEKKQVATPVTRNTAFFSFLRYWKTAGVSYKKLCTGLLLFALFNSSDIFLLLQVKETTQSDITTLYVYIFYNVVYALASYPLGILADKLNMKTVLTGGLLVFAGVYGGMALHPGTAAIFGLFACYGLYAAATEGVAKAWLSSLAVKGETATAIGFYTSLQSICSLLASIITGWVWYRFGAETAFAGISLLTLMVGSYIWWMVPTDRRQV